MLRRLLSRKWAPVTVLAVLAVAVIGVALAQREGGTGGGLLGTATDTTYPLTITVQGPGIVMGSPLMPNYPIICNNNTGSCTANVPAGTTVGVMALINSTTQFTGWGGCTTTNGTTCVITMNGEKTVTGAFGQTPVANPVAITITPPRSGYLKVVPPSTVSVFCGSGTPIPSVCRFPIQKGGTVRAVLYDNGGSGDALESFEITPAPSACTLSNCSFPVNSNTTIAAKYPPPSYITSIKVVTGATWQAAVCPAGYGTVNRPDNSGGQDFNEGAGGDWVSLCYKTATSGLGYDRINAVLGTDLCLPSGSYFLDPTLALQEQTDLNAGQGLAARIKLCMWPSATSTADVVDRLLAVSASSRPSAGQECGYWGSTWKAAPWSTSAWTGDSVKDQYGPNSGYTPKGGAADMNKDVSGKYLYVCQHFLPH
ncbi:MAG: hypothetical protein NTZ05_21810 [Chloroflexi bacterium]|nr:hypothetical protein [Chloroflexota bacterium]